MAPHVLAPPTNVVSPAGPQAAGFSCLKPSPPRPNSNQTYWHRTTSSFQYLHHNKDTPLPTSPMPIPYLVIGAGLTGALTAFKLLEAGVEPCSITILEAREAVSGSTGRNAGHVRPDAFRNFSQYTAKHGTAQALKIVDTEHLNLRLISEFVRHHEIVCDFVRKRTYDICFDEEVADDETSNIAHFANAGGDLSTIEFLQGPDQIEARLGIAKAIKAWGWDAASIHPAKLAQWILTCVIEKGVGLWTHCPVASITREGGTIWKVHTSKGSLSAKMIAHCTNAYAGALLEQLPPKALTPVPVQVSSYTPTSTLSAGNSLKGTMAVRDNMRLFYGLTQVGPEGTLIVSVGKPSGIAFDDSTFNEDVVKETLDRLDALFPKSFEKAFGWHREGFGNSWTGLISFTPDKVPYVGELEQQHQYICAGFNGHGMANIFTCASAVAGLMTGQEWHETGLPECYQYSRERMLKMEAAK